MEELIKAVINNSLRDVWTSIPAEVVSFDTKTNKASVKPLCRRPDLIAPTDANYDLPVDISKLSYTSLPIIYSVMVKMLITNGGDTYINMPIKKGDKGMLMFTSLPINEYVKTSGAEYSPTTGTYHDLNNAYFVPGIIPFGVTNPIAVEEATDLVVHHKNAHLVLQGDGKFEFVGKDGAKLLDSLCGILSMLSDLGNSATLTTSGGGPVAFVPGTGDAWKSNVEGYVSELEKIKG